MMRATAVKCLSYNVCFGCMDESKREMDVTAWPYSSRYCKPDAAGANPCLENVRRILRDNRADVVALQEAEQYGRLGLASVYSLRDARDGGNVVVLGVDKRRFVVRQSVGSTIEPGRPVLCVHCEEAGTGLGFVIVNLHNGHSKDTARVQTAIDALVSRLRGVRRPYHVIVMGDFNDHGKLLLWKTGLRVIDKTATFRGAGEPPPLTCCKHARGAADIGMYGDYVLSDMRTAGVELLDADAASDHRAIVSHLTTRPEEPQGPDRPDEPEPRGPDEPEPRGPDEPEPRIPDDPEPRGPDDPEPRGPDEPEPGSNEGGGGVVWMMVASGVALSILAMVAIWIFVARMPPGGAR